jgi:hypothetical protein
MLRKIEMKEKSNTKEKKKSKLKIFDSMAIKKNENNILFAQCLLF